MRLSQEEQFRAQEEREQALEDLGKSPVKVMKALEEARQVTSAADPDKLVQLSWTLVRIVEIGAFQTDIVSLLMLALGYNLAHRNENLPGTSLDLDPGLDRNPVPFRGRFR